jgi:hypothetical protein
MRYVVDTNVPIVANGGKGTNASAACRLKVIDFLEELMSRGRLVVDSAGEIESEYAKNLNYGQPGVGNRFIQAFLTTASKRLERVEIVKRSDGSYVDFPNDQDLKKFDLSDRKFAALSKKSGAPVANATDSDWLNDMEKLEKHGIKVHFVCSKDAKSWFST